MYMCGVVLAPYAFPVPPSRSNSTVCGAAFFESSQLFICAGDLNSL